MTDEETPAREAFTIEIIRFERDGEKFATIVFYEGEVQFDETKGNHIPNLQSRHSYCDKEEIIERAFYRARTAAARQINNAGLPAQETKNEKHIKNTEPELL